MTVRQVSRASSRPVPHPRRRSLGGAQKELYAIRGTVPTAGNFSAGCRFADRCEYCEERCRAQVPPLVEIAPGHLCRCFLHPARKEGEA